LPETGVTGFLPTLVSSPPETIARAAAWPELVAPAAAAARPLGLHLEGPFLSPARAGAHRREVIAAAEQDPDRFDQLLATPHLALVTLAPERPGAIARIERLVAAGIPVSLGHTAADEAEMRAGFGAGARLVTHLYNAMSGFHHRAPGAVGAAITDTRVRLGLIADGVHAAPTALEVAVRAAGPERIALVTDAMAAAGMPPGRYTLAGRAVDVDLRAARLEDGTLAGSILAIDQAVRNLARWTSLAPEQVLRMASAVPARALGLAHTGELEVGRDADLVLLDRELDIVATYVAGELAFERAR
jgi:N-acetylglucosamine-6-phosphate deacetylase